MRHTIIIKLRDKLRSGAGESLIETLVSMLVASAALLMLGGAITSATRMVTKSRDTLGAYYANESFLARMPDATPDPDSLRLTATDGKITVNNQKYDVTFYVNSVFAQTPVISYDYTPDNSGGGEIIDE